jgi:hypothetical protein
VSPRSPGALLSLVVAGRVTAAGGVGLLSRMPVHGSCVADVLPGMAIMSVGLGAFSIAATIAATPGIRPDKAGLAAAFLNISQQIGRVLGLAIFSAIATSRTNHLLTKGTRSAGNRHPLPTANLGTLSWSPIWPPCSSWRRSGWLHRYPTGVFVIR